MKEKKIPFWRIAAALTVLAGLFVGIGYSSFVLDNYETIDTSCSTGIGPVNPDQQQGKMVTVNFKYQTCERMDLTPGTKEALGTITVNSATYTYNDMDQVTNITDENSYNFLSDLIKTFSGLSISPNTIASGENIYQGINSFSDYELIVNVITKIEIREEDEGVCGGTKTVYSGSYSLCKREKAKITPTYTSSDAGFSIEIPEGEILSRNLISSYLNNDNVKPNYTFVGFADSDLSLLPSDYRIKADDTSFYIVLNNDEGLTGVKNCLSDTINGLNTGSATFNASSAQGEFNVSNDLSYFSLDKSVFLKKETTIKEGVTVNFGLNGGDITKTATTGSSSFEVNSNNLQYKVVLMSDLYIEGKLVIGSNYGVSASNQNQGMIVGEYVDLDLNGHNIYVESTGKLESYGLMEDSVGTGCIYVRGGQLQTMVTIQDYRGGSTTNGLANEKKVFPFEVYSIPYLRCHARLEGSNNGGGIGQFLTLAHICMANDVTPASPILNFIGPSNSDSEFLFTIENLENQNSYVDIIGYSLDGMENSASDNDKSHVISRRTKLVLHNVDCKMNSLKIDLGKISNYLGDISFETKEFIFPIPGFFDIFLESSKLEITSRIKFMPGSSFIADENSIVGFSYTSDNKYSAQFSALDKNFYYYDENQNPVKTDNITDKTGDYYGKGYFTSDSLAKYLSGHERFKIYGTLAFRTGNDMAYVLSGYIDFNKNKIATYNGDNFANLTYISESENPFSIISSNQIKIRTYNFSTILGYDLKDGTTIIGKVLSRYAYFLKGYALPLISRGQFYFVDNESSSAANTFGTWDENTGAMTSGNNTYILSCDADWKADDDGSGCSLLPVTYDSNRHIFTDSNGNKYVYFSEMYCRVDQDNSTQLVIDTSRLSEVHATTTVQYDSNLQRWLRL